MILPIEIVERIFEYVDIDTNLNFGLIHVAERIYNQCNGMDILHKALKDENLRLVHFILYTFFERERKNTWKIARYVVRHELVEVFLFMYSMGYVRNLCDLLISTDGENNFIFDLLFSFDDDICAHEFLTSRNQSIHRYYFASFPTSYLQFLLEYSKKKNMVYQQNIIQEHIQKRASKHTPNHVFEELGKLEEEMVVSRINV